MISLLHYMKNESYIKFSFYNENCWISRVSVGLGRNWFVIRALQRVACQMQEIYQEISDYNFNYAKFQFEDTFMMEPPGSVPSKPKLWRIRFKLSPKNPQKYFSSIQKAKESIKIFQKHVQIFFFCFSYVFFFGI